MLHGGNTVVITVGITIFLRSVGLGLSGSSAVQGGDLCSSLAIP